MNEVDGVDFPTKGINIPTVSITSGADMVQMYEKGQIVIPKYIRDALHLKPGAQLAARMENRKIILEAEDDYFEEFERLTSEHAHTFSDAETEKRILKAKKSMEDGWLRVP